MHIAAKDVPDLVAWLRLGRWEFKNDMPKGVIHGVYPEPRPELIMTPLIGHLIDVFELHDAHRFIVDAFRQRDLTAWAFHHEIRISMNVGALPGDADTWRAQRGEAGSWLGPSPEAVALRVACEQSLPSWEGWLRPPKTESEANARGYIEDPGREKTPCAHRLPVIQTHPGFPNSPTVFYCPIHRYYYYGTTTTTDAGTPSGSLDQ